MKGRKIRENVYLLGAIDWNRRLFDALMPLPDGTSYNAYLVQGSQKTALIDTVDPTKWEVLQHQLEGVAKIDHIVIQHMEQDHSGSLPFVLQRYPQATVVTNPRCKGMLIDHLHIAEDRFITVEDGAKLQLGNKTLTFVYTPWVHLPETMSTWLEEDRVLFSCDFFASHLATSDVWANETTTYEPAKRYYAEIMMPFASVIVKNLAKLKPYPVEAICPSHGPLYRRPAFILEAYNEWATGEPKNMVCLPYVSMHGSTELLVHQLTASLVEQGVAVQQFDLAVAELGQLALSLVDAATIVIGTPTVHAGPHPSVVSAAFIANALKPKAKYATVIGSFGWGSKTVEKLVAMLDQLKVELLDPVMCKGQPRAADYAALAQLANTIAAKHAALASRDP